MAKVLAIMLFGAFAGIRIARNFQGEEAAPTNITIALLIFCLIIMGFTR